MFVNNTEELAQNKLLILYIIDLVDYPLSNERLTEFLLKKDYMNYFVIQQYLLELLEAGFIAYENPNEKTYKILNKGKTTLFYFQNRLPITVKEDIVKEFLKAKNNKKNMEGLSNYEETNDSQYMISLQLLEDSKLLFHIKLKVETENQAKEICHIWNNNPESLYTKIFALLTDKNPLIKD